MVGDWTNVGGGDWWRWGSGKFGEVFVGVGLEFLEAHFAAEFHFLGSVEVSDLFVPFVEWFLGDGAGGEGVGFDFGDGG